MNANPIKTIALPFEKSLVPLSTDDRGVFLNAAVLPNGSVEWTKILTCEQGFRPDFLALEQAGFEVRPDLQSVGADFALIRLDRHKRVNWNNLARASALVKPGGVIVIAGAKTDGIASVRKRVHKTAPVSGSLSKHHAVVFWFENQTGAWDTEVSNSTAPEGYLTRPGMFSHDRIDPGSALLASNIKGRVSGNVADFGAGWGYLACELAEQEHRLSSLELYEADWHALQAAGENLSARTKELRTNLFWHDLILEPVTRTYDCIVMNPPFHAGRAGQPEIGQRFIAAASGALRKGGKLLMVANRHLPYEQTLAKKFRRVQPLVEDANFKVLEAIR